MIRVFTISLIVTALIAGALEAKPVGQQVAYEQGGAALEGWFVRSDEYSGELPGVVIVHQWRGLSDYEKKRAEMLAELGYAVFCADIYGAGVRPESPEDAGAQAGKFRGDPELFRARLSAAVDEIKKQDGVDSSRIAAIGYCFGGGGVIELARTGAELAGVVSFHGSFETKLPAAGSINTKILALHGADDRNISGGQLIVFEDEMRAAGADYQIILYGGAVHSFTDWNAGDDPARGSAYHETADYRSWRAMLDFFAEIFV